MTKRLLIAALASVVIIAALAQAFAFARTYYQGRAQEAARATLSLVVEAIDQTVGGYAPMPGLIAGDPALRQMLDAPSAQGLVPFMNEKLRQTAISVKASEVYVMDQTGLTIATSNYRDADSFLGKSFAFRPYFLEAVAGKASMFHALGTTSGERGFFFSAPILDGIRVVGVLVVKITLEDIEQDWLSTTQEILISDGDGVVFLASRPEYRFRALAPLSQSTLDRIARTQQYPLDRILPVGFSADVIGPDVVQVTLGNAPEQESYLARSAPLSLAGWHAIVLTSLGQVNRQAYWALALGGSALTALLLAVLLILQRRANILLLIRFEQDQRALLEDKVRQRTADLDTANASLRDEVADRRRAEERLRKSQKELVQAGKLAALGQMSAAISHEMNQPLAAIKSYAENAATYLERSRPEEAKANVESISKLSDRMAEISHHLRNFARQPGDTLKPINVAEAITETIGLVGPQLRASNAQLHFTPPPEPVWALGGKLRFQQVLVNIVNNALEAMAGQKAPEIEVSLGVTPEKVEVSLRDHGPGVPSDVLDHVFDAFYTTKEAGRGMGLGMSISHNIISDFGGTLSVSNHAEGGAVFSVTLQAHRPEQAGEAG